MASPLYHAQHTASPVPHHQSTPSAQLRRLNAQQQYLASTASTPPADSAANQSAGGQRLSAHRAARASRQRDDSEHKAPTRKVSLSYVIVQLQQLVNDGKSNASSDSEYQTYVDILATLQNLRARHHVHTLQPAAHTIDTLPFSQQRQLQYDKHELYELLRLAQTLSTAVLASRATRSDVAHLLQSTLSILTVIITYKLQQLMYQQLIQHVIKLHNSRRYWQHHCSTSTSHTLLHTFMSHHRLQQLYATINTYVASSDTSLLHINTDNEKVLKLNQLLALDHTLTIQVGKLARRMSSLQHVFYQSMSESKLQQLVKKCPVYLQQTNHHIQQCITQRHDHHSSTAPQPSHNDVQYTLLTAEQLLTQLEAYNTSVAQRVYTLKRPSHFIRHWHYYTMLTTLSGLTIYRCYKDRHTLYRYALDANQSVRLFANEHVLTPAREIYGEVFSAFQLTKPSITTVEDINVSRAALAQMLDEFGRDNIETIAAIENKTREQVLSELPQRAKAGDMAVVSAKYTSEIKHPIINAVKGDLLRAILIQVQKLKLDSEEALFTMDQLLKSNSINFSMLSALPALFIAFFAAWGLTRGIAVVTRKPSKRAVYRHVREQVGEIERLLIGQIKRDAVSETHRRRHHAVGNGIDAEEHNAHTNGDSVPERTDDSSTDNCSDTEADEYGIESSQLLQHSSSELFHDPSALPSVHSPDWSYGRLLVYLHQLQRTAVGLSEKQRNTLQPYSHMLASYTLTPYQKYLTVQSLYHSSPWFQAHQSGSLRF